MPQELRSALEPIKPGTVDYVIIASVAPGETLKTEPVTALYFGAEVKRALRLGFVEEVSQAMTSDGPMITVRLTTEGVLYLGEMMHEIQSALSEQERSND